MCESYREQLQRLVGALGQSNSQAVVDDLQPGSSLERVRLFVDGNSEKRFEKLSDQLEFVAEAFDNFERQIEVFVREQPLSAYDTGVSDGERMLLWLLDKRSLTPVQRDYVLCQRARHAVEELARCHRAGHLRFQRLRGLQPADVAGIDLNQVRLHVNPIRANSTFITSALLDSLSEPPTEVLFFPDNHEIATAVLEPFALQSLHKLAAIEPCTLQQWADELGCELSALVEIARELLEVGLLAAELN